MAKSLIQKGTIAVDAKFINRVTVAVVTYALAVLDETPTEVEGWPERGTLAERALSDRDAVAIYFVMALATNDQIADLAYGSGTTMNTDNIGDNAINTGVSTVWNKIAGAAQSPVV
jgi:hypothetical protein